MTFTLIEKLTILQDCNGAIETIRNQAIKDCIRVYLNHDFWLSIDAAPVRTPIIAWAKGWEKASEVVLDDNRVAYLPGSDCILSPQPTHFQPMPKPPEVGP